MLSLYLTVFYLVLHTNASVLGSVRAHNVTKREGNIGDLFPDWVPFKNKHGEELGEFVQVSKPKPKKRLAPPVNFILRAVAEPQGDDYYDKGQGESDGDEYYEKKEWSDTNRPEVEVENKPQNHTQISEIDGVVNIITKKPSNPVVEAIKKAKQVVQTVTEATEKVSEEATTLKSEQVSPEELKENKSGKDSKDDDNVEYEEEENSDKKPSPEEQSESEAKKASILDSVDELKERHAEEQREINEKVKEEEIYKEERERDKIIAQLSNPEHDKYENKRSNVKKLAPVYDDDYDVSYSTEEKYAPPKLTKKTTTQRTKNTKKSKKDKQVESGKLSVFKNPRLFVVYDDDLEEANSTPKSKKVNSRGKGDKYSSKYSSTPTTDEDSRISLVPVEGGKEGEPTLFFPKKRKSKKRKTKKTFATDSTGAETISTNRAKKINSAKVSVTSPGSIVYDTTGSSIIPSDSTISGITDTTASGSTASDTTADSAITDILGADSVSTKTAAITDALPASTDHKDHKKPENYHREKGTAKQYTSSHEEEHNEGGKKAYEGVHEDTKSAKGHHEKEDHLNKYDDHGGVDEHSEEESGHYGAHHHEEHGKKHAKYEESGKHSKGHSTKGSHDIHKKEEYEKKVEFFEEEGDSSEEEKHGGYNHEHGHSEGGHFKKGGAHAGHSKHSKGDSGHFAKGGHLHAAKGHKEAGGHDGHGRHGEEHGGKGGRSSGKKWLYYHGHPAKNANLVRIDRRAENAYRGPVYFG